MKFPAKHAATEVVNQLGAGTSSVDGTFAEITLPSEVSERVNVNADDRHAKRIRWSDQVTIFAQGTGAGGLRPAQPIRRLSSTRGFGHRAEMGSLLRLLATR